MTGETNTNETTPQIETEAPPQFDTNTEEGQIAWGRHSARLYFQAFGFIKKPGPNIKNPNFIKGWMWERAHIILHEQK